MATAAIPASDFPSAPGEILTWWFGEEGKDEHYLQFRKLWFFSTPALDEDLRVKFGEPLEAAQAGALRSWEDAPVTMAAKIILLDQFSRNVFRGSPKAFAGDAEALRCTLAGLKKDEEAASSENAQKWFSSLPDMMRYFCLMPLMHAEDLSMQRLGAEQFKTLSFYASSADLQREVATHLGLIERFGRFPHRNAVLGRANTPAEDEYLKGEGAKNHYGQQQKKKESDAEGEKKAE